VGEFSITSQSRMPGVAGSVCTRDRRLAYNAPACPPSAPAPRLRSRCTRTTLRMTHRTPWKARDPADPRPALNTRLSDGVALAPVAVGAEELEVLKRRRAAVGDGQDVVVLEVERAAALDAAATVALEDGSPQLGRDGGAGRAAIFLSSHQAPHRLQLLLQAALALARRGP
jgi:hypothetical protein